MYCCNLLGPSVANAWILRSHVLLSLLKWIFLRDSLYNFPKFLLVRPNVGPFPDWRDKIDIVRLMLALIVVTSTISCWNLIFNLFNSCKKSITKLKWKWDLNKHMVSYKYNSLSLNNSNPAGMHFTKQVMTLPQESHRTAWVCKTTT